MQSLLVNPAPTYPESLRSDGSVVAGAGNIQLACPHSDSELYIAAFLVC